MIERAGDALYEVTDRWVGGGRHETTVRPLKTIRLGVRLDLIGGWSDQPDFRRPAAVLNACVGWDGGYPLQLDRDGNIRSEVAGIGTGLGISSVVRLAECGGEWGSLPGGIAARSLQWERENGSYGGWQDSLGILLPGLKLIETEDYCSFSLQRNDAHPLFNHLILFDTGTRRNSGVIGAKVRKLMQGDGQFNDSLSEIVRAARAVYASPDPLWGAEHCLAAWRILAGYVPEMSDGLDRIPTLGGPCLGMKYCGAGGGGFGLMFVRNPEDRETVRAFLASRGLWARVPELLEGARWAG